MADIKKALARMETIIANWFIDDFMMLGAWTLMEKIPDPKMSTMGIDTRTSPASFRYNPNFINALDNETLEMVMGAQGLKLLLRHPTTRMKNPRDISALSSSITVDQLVVRDQSLGDLKDVIPMPTEFNLPENQSHEIYFRMMNEKLDETRSKLDKKFGKSKTQEEKEELEKEQKEKQKQKQNGKGEESPDGTPEKGEKGDCDESCEGSCDCGEGDGESGEGEPQDGNGGGSGEGEQEFKEFKNQKDAMKEHMDPRGDESKHWGENDMLDAEVENMVNEYKGSSQKWGSVSGNAFAQIVAANTPKINWKEVIRRFNTSVTTSKQVSTRMKYNRRFGLDAPGRKRIYTTKILFALDVSGSMSDQDIAEGFAVVNSVCRHAEVHWMTFDTEIHDLATKMKKAQTMFKVNGRGGTDPGPVLKYADEHKYDGVVVYSDMDFYSAQKRPARAKVLWLATDKCAKNPTDFGFFASLDRNSR